MRLSKVGGYVEFVARQREREQEPKTASDDTHAKETIFEENIGLEADGYVYHPNLLEFTLGGLFGLVQGDFEHRSGDRERNNSDSGTVVEFDFDAQILKRKSYPVSISAHRRRGLTPRPFLPSLETTATDYGIIMQYVSTKVPTSLQFRHSEVELTPLFLGGDGQQEGRQKNTLFRFETGYNFSDRNTLSLIYEHESVEEQPYNLDYDSDELTLTHRLVFGTGLRSRLESEVNYFDQRGTYAIERLRLRETLRLMHSETLRSQYELQVLDRTRGSRSRDVSLLEERSFYVSGLLEHRLYDSLTSQLLGFVQRQEFEPKLEVDRIGGEIGLDYRKKNPWGVLLAAYRVRVERDDRQGDLDAVEVIDEARTFKDPDPIVLTARNIRTNSITIRAEDRVTFYRVGRDYTVRSFGNWVEIEREPTGWITDGQTVLVDYVFNPGGSFTLDTVSQNFAIRQNFDFGLSPYYRLEWQDQTISPAGAIGVVPEDVTAHILGVEFKKTSLRLTAEYEDRDSTITPFEAVRLEASYMHRFKSRATASLSARWTSTSHRPPNEREVKLLTLQGRYRHPITTNLNVEGTVLYRLAEDSLSGDDTGVDVFLSLDWFVRQTEVKLTFDLGQYEDDFTRSDSSALYVQIRRRF